MIGFKFNKLTVIAELPPKLEVYGKYSAKRNQWLCKCECGQERIVAGNKFKNTKACRDCTHKSFLESTRRPRRYSKTTKKLTNTKQGEVGQNKLLGEYKRNALKRGHVWELTREQFVNLTSSNCYYCDIEPRQVITVGRSKKSENTKKSAYVYNGIDRKDNSMGYTTENSVPCCGRCNHMKGKMDSSTFIEQMKKIVERFGESND